MKKSKRPRIRSKKKNNKVKNISPPIEQTDKQIHYKHLITY